MRPKEFEPDAIADAAMNVFWQRGYASTSVQDLVDGTGLGRSSIYNFFGSKHELYESALRRYHDWSGATLDVLNEADPVKELIRRILMSIVDDELDSESHNGCMVANASLELAGHDPIVAALVAENFDRMERAFDGALCRAQRDGEVAPDKDPKILAKFIVNTIQGIRVLGKGSAESDRRERLLGVVDTAMSVL